VNLKLLEDLREMMPYRSFRDSQMTRNFFVCLPPGYLFENLKISTGHDLCRFALQARYSVPKSQG
jgi:hypothetical protein